MYWYNLALLMMSTFWSKHVEAWNKYIKKECVNLVIAIIITKITVVTMVCNVNSFWPSFDLPFSYSLLQPTGSWEKLNLIFGYKFTCVDRALKYKLLCVSKICEKRSLDSWSLSPSICVEQLVSHRTDLHEIWHLSIFSKIFRKISSCIEFWQE
jgi:hypothetical protein